MKEGDQSPAGGGACCPQVIPYLVMFTYLGSLARTLSDIFGGLAGPDTRTTILLGALSGVLLVAIVWWTTQMAK